MLDLTSIRFRLAAWYFLCLTLILAIFGFGARYAIRRSILDAVDRDLRDRMEDVREFVDEQSKFSPQHLVHELEEQGETGLGGGLVELRDESGSLMFRSARWQNVDAEIRDARQDFTSYGRHYTARVAEPMHAFNESLRTFDRILLLSAPLLLLLASLGGYWISGRALAPVDRITRDAESIGITNLSQRVETPTANDELRRLALTLNKMLDRIEQAVQRMTQFTADASHELRAPLTLIHTAAEFSLRGERPPAELTEGLRRILRESDRMSQLIDDLLLLARADSGADQIVLTPVDLVQAASTAAESVRGPAAAKQQRLDVRLPSSPVLVLGDEEALIRIVVILLDNAVKYTQQGGCIRLEAQQSDHTAVVRVTDTGIGISPEDLPKIWDRFWRADKVRSRNGGGAGLGLAIARSIAQRHRAELDVQSEPGKGSTFTLRLDLVPVSEPQN
jgi:heavy metal sensor kinase